MKQDKAKIKYGDVSVDDAEFEPKNQKVRVTAFVDGDIVLWLKREAEKRNIGYQTLMNLRLRELMEIEPSEDLDMSFLESNLPAKVKDAIMKDLRRMMERVQKNLETDFSERLEKLEKKRA